MTPLPTPQQLRYLLALFEQQHFGRAADACAVTQSTLSAGLLALERQLDAAILDRSSGRRVVFTPLGQELVGHARCALGALNTMAEAAQAGRAPMRGRLRLGIIPTLGPFLLPRLLPALREEFPGLQLSLVEDVTERLVTRLRDNVLDAALLALPCACAEADTLPLARDPFLAALPHGHPLAELPEIPLPALRAERLLLLEDGHCLRDQALEACGFNRGERPGGEAEGFAATSLHTLAQMVAGGLGVTLLPRIAVRAGLVEGGGIVLRPIAGGGACRTLALGWRPKSPRAADFRALAPVLAEQVA